MKASKSLLLLGLTGLVLGGCVQNRDVSQAAIAETYVHKYGLAVEKSDWEERGQDGRIVSTRKDGVLVNRNYSGGQLHGDSTFSFPNSDVIAKIESYDQGTLVAEQENYPCGTPMRERQVLLGSESLETHWYATGTPRCRETWRGELLVAAEYFTPSNKLEGRVEGGEGHRIGRNSEGELLSEDTISKGLMTRRTMLYANGQPESITTYVGGKEHGERRTYLPGGVPNTIETWANGELNGLTTVFANGEKKSEIPFEHGRRHGIERRYGSDGAPVEEISWLRDVRHGADQFLVDGDRTIDWYHHGQLVSKAIFDRLNPNLH